MPNAVQYVWEGWSIMAVLDEDGALLESYTRGPGVAYDVGSLVAVRHHSGIDLRDSPGDRMDDVEDRVELNQ